jgi:Kef-type K+ transport system membrane component KefB
MDDVAFIILQIFIILLLSKIFGGIFEKMKMPKLVGEIIAGALFINLIIFVPEVGDFLKFSIAEFNSETEISFFHIMGELGIVFLLFSVGLETKFSEMKKVGKAASYIAILGIVIPFSGGMLFVFMDEISLEAALLIGAALFGTSTAVGVECLRNMNAMKTNEAKLIISATIIDDILCLALLGVIIGAIKPDASTFSIALNAVIVAVFVLIMFVFVAKVKKIAGKRRKRKHKLKEKHADPTAEIECECDPPPMGELSSVGLAILVCMGLAALSVNIGLAAIIGSFLAGMIFAEFKETIPCEHNFNVVTYFMLPFFFIWVGMELQFDRINPNIMPLLCAVLIVAVITKYLAGFIGGKMGKLSNDSSHLIGISFIPRGEVGIIVATIGLSTAVFSPDMFTIVILMALITSMVVPPLMTHAYQKIEKNRAAAFEDIIIEGHTENE